MGTLFVDKLDPQSGTSLEIGSNGDTITIPSGATIANSGTATGFGMSSANTPVFSVRRTGNYELTDNVTEKVTWDTELVDTDNAFASNKFTVPSGKAGNYFLYTMVLGRGDANSRLDVFYCNIYKNGSRIAMAEQDLRSNAGRKMTSTVNTIQSLSVGDYIEVYVGVDVNTGSPRYDGGDFQMMFGGFKLT